MKQRQRKENAFQTEETVSAKNGGRREYVKTGESQGLGGKLGEERKEMRLNRSQESDRDVPGVP